MKFKFKNYINKILCVIQRIKYKFLFYGMDIDPWHLSGTFYCRNYKIKTLEIINRIKPNYYIDIGCGLGEILNKVDLNSKSKFGLDIDKSLFPAIRKLGFKFYFSSNKKSFFNILKKNIKGKNNKIVASLLGFSHKISDKKLFQFLEELDKILGPFILITDSVYNESKEYKYSHKNFLDKQEEILDYVNEVDQIRSLYCINFNKNIVY